MANKMVTEKYQTKTEAINACKPGQVTVWKGPAITNQPGWYNVSQIRGKRCM